MDIEHMNVDQSPNGHQTIRQRQSTMKTLIIGSIILGIFVTIFKSMDMLLKIAFQHISKVTTKDG